MSALTEIEWSVLYELSLRPHGAPIRGDEEKKAVLSLADKVLVCDPHTMGNCLFTRITDEGRALLNPKGGETDV